MAKTPQRKRIRALKIHQWLKSWDEVDFDSSHHRRKPEPFFYLFVLQAAELRSLCGISRRETKGVRPRAVDLGIQRQHDPDRSSEIAKFVEYGYPWSTLSDAKRASDEFNDLRKPGWLPTAVVINILSEGQEREGEKIRSSDVVSIEDSALGPDLLLPYSEWSKSWSAKVPPFEVIDGQHRLVARAALLLRIASGSVAQLLRAANFSGKDIEFWWSNLGSRRDCGAAARTWRIFLISGLTLLYTSRK